MLKNRTTYQPLLSVGSVLIAATGLSIGNRTQAGDMLPPYLAWVLGLGLFLCGIWLFGKRRVGLQRTDLKEFVGGLAFIFVMAGFSLVVYGSGPNGLYQNDGYSIMAGLLILYGGGLIGYILGERRAQANAHSVVSELQLLVKNKGGKK
jgi:hypothetical protein